MARTMIFVLAILAFVSLVGTLYSSLLNGILLTRSLQVFAAPSQDTSPVIPKTHTHGDMEFKGKIHGVDFQANGTVEVRL